MQVRGENEIGDINGSMGSRVKKNAKMAVK